MFDKSNENYDLYLAGLISENKYYDIIENKLATIPRKHPVRNAIASHKIYWDKPGHALTDLQGILFDHGFQLAHVGSFNVHDKTPDHTQNFPLMKMNNPEKPEEGGVDIDSMLVFNWHWMPSGNKCEVTAYIS